jgi:uncharacterized protein (DUF983 family)
MFLLRKTGIRCHSCGRRYVIQQGRAVVANFVLLFGGAGALGVLLASSKRSQMRSLSAAELVAWSILGIGLLVILQTWLVPRLLGLRRLKAGEEASFPLEISYGD